VCLSAGVTALRADLIEFDGIVTSTDPYVTVTPTTPQFGATEAWIITVDPNEFSGDSFNVFSQYWGEPPSEPDKANLITPFTPTSAAPGAPWQAMWYSDVPYPGGVPRTPFLGDVSVLDSYVEKPDGTKAGRFSIIDYGSGEGSVETAPDRPSTGLLFGLSLLLLFGVQRVRRSVLCVEDSDLSDLAGLLGR
jgi:hypothetical protein